MPKVSRLADRERRNRDEVGLQGRDESGVLPCRRLLKRSEGRGSDPGEYGHRPGGRSGDGQGDPVPRDGGRPADPRSDEENGEHDRARDDLGLGIGQPCGEHRREEETGERGGEQAEVFAPLDVAADGEEREGR